MYNCKTKQQTMQPVKAENKFVLIKNVAAIKMMQLSITKRNALYGEIIPFGISRIAVLGFFASKLLSR